MSKPLPGVVDKGGADTLKPFGRAFGAGRRVCSCSPPPASFFVAYAVTDTILRAGFSATCWLAALYLSVQLVDFDSDGAYVARLETADGFRYIGMHVGVLVALSALCAGLGLLISVAVGIGVKWILIGRRREGAYDWDQRCGCAPRPSRARAAARTPPLLSLAPSQLRHTPRSYL